MTYMLENVLIDDKGSLKVSDFGLSALPQHFRRLKLGAKKLALEKYHQVIWQGRVLKTQFSDEELRNQGRCPLTPEEIELLLAALGFTNNTRLYQDICEHAQ
ncbi:O-fucosyltransferase 31 [Bienertia sinuspersici]